MTVNIRATDKWQVEADCSRNPTASMMPICDPVRSSTNSYWVVFEEL